ncbi:UNKNOWN [Stylonychia lemnae]|uniref:Acyltransferase 3 domain-containing protein n=1 Tax=Stylonychia lemnae TaxID=5949 RepID=A0A078BBV2_STYLE|nr:UNKNOWN [Stylonychia lemnae]|eukprot:CDW91686.1 UNKNOWN [Stylonychia lemnae]
MIIREKNLLLARLEQDKTAPKDDDEQDKTQDEKDTGQNEPAKEEDITCVKYLKNVTNYFMEYNKTVTKILRYSGKDYNDFGKYEDCLNIKDEKFSYILATIPRVFPIPISLGLCLPAICTSQDFNNAKPYLIEVINQYIPEIFQGLKGFDLSLQIKESDLHFENSKARNDEAAKADALTYIMIILIVFLSITVIASSFLSWRSKKQTQDRRQSQKNQKVEKEQTKNAINETMESLRSEQIYNLDSDSSDNQSVNSINSRNSQKSGDEAQPKKKKKGRKLTHFQKIVKSFSVQNSMRTLFTQRQKTNDIPEFNYLNFVRVSIICWIIFGNTYYYILKGPLQNIEVIQEWMSDLLFAIVLSAELVADIFFWLTAFLGCYYLLIKTHENSGAVGPIFKFYFKRLVRLFPAYAFTLFFFWKILLVTGGDGPAFFSFQYSIECSKYWIWHLTFLNNLIPWNQDDTCMDWTWYLANDMQFYLLIPLFVKLYYNNRKWFFIIFAIFLSFSMIVQIGVIAANDLSASYFTYKDEYFTIYYVKPYSRLPSFLFGVLGGCAFYTFKNEDPESMRVSKVFQALLYAKPKAIASHILGTILMILMSIFLQIMNNTPNGSSNAINILFLVFGRMLFIIGFSMQIFPILVGSPVFQPIRLVLSHDLITPFSRLSYGAFLSHAIFMQFREYNVERGQWACAFDAFLMFLAYTSLAFLYSLWISLLFDFPLASLYSLYFNRQKKRRSVSNSAIQQEQNDQNNIEEGLQPSYSIQSENDSSERRRSLLTDHVKKNKKIYSRDRSASGDTEDLEDTNQQLDNSKKYSESPSSQYQYSNGSKKLKTNPSINKRERSVKAGILKKK